MANRMYLLGRQAFLAGSIAMGSDNIKASLVSASVYTAINTSTDQFFSIIPSTVADSGNLSSKTLNTPNPGTFDAADVTWSSVTGAQCDYVVLWKDTGTGSTSPLICVFDTGTNLPVTPNGGDITAQWSSGTDRIFTLLEAVDVEQLMKEGLTLRNLVRKWLQRSIRFGDREFEREGSLWMPGPKMVQTPARLASNA